MAVDDYFYVKKDLQNQNIDMKKMFEFWGGKRFFPIDAYLKRHFGQKTIKLAIDGGFTCPNRDGSKGHGGCIFCSDNGSGEFASDVETQIALLSSKWPNAKYLAYFQNHTNTYASVDLLRQKYFEVLKNPKIEGLVIGTRPDCLSTDVLNLLDEINKKYFLWIELGLQTIHPHTAELINRCYDLKVFDDAMDNLNALNIKTVVHLILGLPGESKAMILDSISYAAQKEKLFGMKLHLLNVVKGSQMASSYKDYQPFSSIDEYVNLVVEGLELIPPHVTIHRLTGDAPRDILISPPWSFNKRTILNRIDERLNLLDTWQGKKI